jgi:CubicO group peptidase (beta-lactamase class C family)
VYRIASLTKLFTATLAMKLRDEGLLDLDRPVTSYISSLTVSNPFPDPQPVTFRQLLSHTSGLPRNIPSDLVSSKKPLTMKKIIRWLNDEPLRFMPFTRYGYSNTGYAIIGYLLSVLGSRSYEKLVDHRITSILGMKNTVFDIVNIKNERLAVGYNSCCSLNESHGTSRTLMKNNNSFAPCLNPAGGLYSNVLDLSRFLASQFHKGPADSGHPLGCQTIIEMHNPVFVEPDWSGASAIGWRTGPVENYTWIGHMGGLPGFSAELMAIPELEFGVVALANQEASIGGICWNSLLRLCAM